MRLYTSEFNCKYQKSSRENTKRKKINKTKAVEVISIAQIYQNVSISVSELFKRSRNNVFFLQMPENFISILVD